MNDVKKIFQKVKLTYCDNDPLPISDIVNSENIDDFFNIVTFIVNNSIESKIFPESEKVAIVKPIVA